MPPSSCNGCKDCGAYYLVDTDINGNPIPPQWILVARAPATTTDVVDPFSFSPGSIFTDTTGRYGPPGGFYYLGLDPTILVNFPDENPTLEEVIAFAWFHNYRTFSPGYGPNRSGVAIDYALACVDTPPPDPNGPVTCPTGYAYDPPSETCKPLCGNVLPCTVPIPVCPDGFVYDPRCECCRQPATPPALCPPPGIIKLVNGVPVCMMDPPVPSHLPSFTPFEGWKPLRIAAQSRIPHASIRGVARVPSIAGPKVETGSPRFSPGMLALNPTRYRGIPHVFKSCGCNDAEEFDEASV